MDGKASELERDFSHEAERWREELHCRTARVPKIPRPLGGLGLTWLYNIYKQDPEEHKVLGRIFNSIVELERLDDLDLLGEEGQDAALRILRTGDPRSLGLDGALRLLDGLDQILVARGGADYLCRRAELAIYREAGTTTLLTWDQLFGSQIPAALTACRAGEEVDPKDLESLRKRLSGFLHARTDVYGVHKARLRMKRRLFVTVTAVLLVLVVAFAFAIAAEPESFVGQVLVVTLAGGIGATLSGALKLRDTLTLGSELREFSSAAILQLIIGAAFALIVLLILESGLLMTSSSSQWAERTVLGFLAGFSEPFALGLVARITA